MRSGELPGNLNNLRDQLKKVFIFGGTFRLFTVVAQAYKVEVEVLGASRGCTAVLRCVVPSFVKELIRVVSWVQEPSFYIYPSLQGGKN